MKSPFKLKPIESFATEKEYSKMRQKLNAAVEKGLLIPLGRVKLNSPDLCIAFKSASTGETWLLTAPDQASRGSFLETSDSSQ